MTLSTSDTNNHGKIALIYLTVSVFLAVFGAVYEHFSFGVYSYFMLYAFLFPLVGGCLPSMILSSRKNPCSAPQIALWLYRCGIATLSVGSIIRGALDIYGTENALTAWYWYVGGGLWAVGGILYMISILRNCNRSISEP